MECTIRRAHIFDANAIARVHVESWKSTYKGIVPEAFLVTLDVEERARQWREWLIACGCKTFVAEDDSEIIGFIAGGKAREEIGSYDAELYAIYLLHPRKRQGIGSMLTHALTQDLKAGGFNSMLAWVLEQNPAASFYMHLGAVEVARKTIEIGGADLSEIAFGWPSLALLAEITESNYRHERIG